MLTISWVSPMYASHNCKLVALDMVRVIWAAQAFMMVAVTGQLDDEFLHCVPNLSAKRNRQNHRRLINVEVQNSDHHKIGKLWIYSVISVISYVNLPSHHIWLGSKGSPSQHVFFPVRYFVQRPSFTQSHQQHCTMNHNWCFLICSYLLLAYFEHFFRATLFLVPEHSQNIARTYRIAPRLHQNMRFRFSFLIIFGYCKLVEAPWILHPAYPELVIRLGT